MGLGPKRVKEIGKGERDDNSTKDEHGVSS